MRLIDSVAFSQAVNAECLSPISITEMSNEVKLVAETMCEPQQCFGNAFQVAHMTGQHSIVLGYVVLNDCGIAIEHAWIEKDGEHCDPTLELFQSRSRLTDNAYFQLHAFPLEDYMDRLDKYQTGAKLLPISHAEMRREPEFSEYWRRVLKHNGNE